MGKSRLEKVKIYGKRLCGRSRVKNLKAFLGHTLPLSSNGKHFSKKTLFVSIKSHIGWFKKMKTLSSNGKHFSKKTLFVSINSATISSDVTIISKLGQINKSSIFDLTKKSAVTRNICYFSKFLFIRYTNKNASSRIKFARCKVDCSECDI